VTPYDAAYFQREDEEYALADFHCAASTIVRDQLAGRGVPAGSIWVVPYGAEEVWKRGFSCRRPRIAPLNFAERWGFSLPSFGGEGRGGEAAFAVGGSWGEESRKEGPFRVVFAGQLALRKGVRFLLRALEMAGRKDWKLDCYGAVLRETETDRRDYRGVIPVQYHGPVRQSHLAEAFRTSSVLVLPSLEEGFGLVVVQALACGLPCIVSDSVGAKDLIQHRVNGSICATGNAEALKTELEWWESHPGRATGDYGWAPCARELLRVSARAK
jgi:glycosyltransferase involved in cell wall biosynthesis